MKGNGLHLLPRALSEEACREATYSNALRPQGNIQELRSLQAPQETLDYHHLNELLHLIHIVSYLSKDTRMYCNLLYSPLPFQKVSVLLNQKFSPSGGNPRSSTSSGAQDRQVPRETSDSHLPFHPPPPTVGGLFPPEVLDHDSYNGSFTRPPFSSTSSSAPARKKEEKHATISKCCSSYAIPSSGSTTRTAAPTFVFRVDR